MLQNIPLSVIIPLTFVIPFIQWAFVRFFSRCGLPKDLPWADGSTGALSRARVTWQSFFGLKKVIQKGYSKYSKNDQVYVLPNLATGPEVIVPQSQMKWLLEQPDHVLNQNEVNRQFLHADITMLHPKVIRDTVHGRVIRQEMTKDLDHYADEIVDEIEHALTVNWGTNTEDWREVKVYDTMLSVIGRISNRVLVGPELCRNPEYLRSSCTFSRSVVLTAGLLNLLPAYLRPVLSPFIMAYDMYHYRKIAKHISPIIQERLPKFKPGMDYKKPDYSEHSDYMQWSLHDAFSHDDQIERSTELITKRLAVLSFAAIQSSVITITNCIFDIASSPHSKEIQQVLREEVADTTPKHPGNEWKKASLAAMKHVDSALRESMRLWGFISRGVMKRVVAPRGVTLPSGHYLPEGSKVGVTSYSVHHDESVYPDAMQFNAFRFCKGKNGFPGAGSKYYPMVTSTDEFMAFSHGRHACPGRFFAANQLKLLLAAICTKYEIEPVSTRPTNPWLNNTIGPPIWETLRVRRLPGSVKVAEPVQEAVNEKGRVAMVDLLESTARQTLVRGQNEISLTSPGPMIHV